MDERNVHESNSVIYDKIEFELNSKGIDKFLKQNNKNSKSPRHYQENDD